MGIEKTTILFVSASPANSRISSGNQELRALYEVQRESRHGECFDIKPVVVASPTDLHNALYDWDPQILHYSGHGTGKELLFQEEWGQPRPVPTEVLKELFAIPEYLRLVVLNACFSCSQGEVIRERIDCVVGVTERIQNHDAVQFTRGFYKALIHNRSVSVAVNTARALMRATQDGTETSPSIELLHKEGVDPDELYFPQRASVALPSENSLGKPESQAPLSTDRPVILEPGSKVRVLAQDGREIQLPWHFADPDAFRQSVHKSMHADFDKLRELEETLRRLYTTVRDVHLSVVLSKLDKNAEHRLHAQRLVNRGHYLAGQFRAWLERHFAHDFPESFKVLLDLSLCFCPLKSCVNREGLQDTGRHFAERMCHWLVLAHAESKKLLDQEKLVLQAGGP